MSAKTKENSESELGASFGEQLAAASNKLKIMPRRDEAKTDLVNELAVIAQAVSEALPDLQALPVANLKEESFRAMQEEVDRKKHWAEQAGPQLLDLESEFKTLERMKEKDPDIAELSSTYAKRYTALEEAIAKIGSVGSELKKHVEFAKLIELIRRCGDDFTAATAVFDRVVAVGRYRLASREEIRTCRIGRKWPIGTIFFNKNAYFLVLKEGEPISQGKMRLGRDLRRLAERVMTAAQQQRIAFMKGQGGDRMPSELFEGKTGKYYFFGSQKNSRGGDHLLLEVVDERNNPGKPLRMVKVVDALGMYSWMKAEGLRQSVPLFWIQNNKVISDRQLDESDFLRAANLVTQIHNLVAKFAFKRNSED